MSRMREKPKASALKAESKRASELRVHGLRPGRVTARRKRPSAEVDRSQLTHLDPIIHERTRLTILTALSTSDSGSCTFTDLRDSLQVTDGNLITHLRTLEQAGLVERKKKGAGRSSITMVHLSPRGRNAFQAYLDQLETLVQKVRKGSP